MQHSTKTIADQERRRPLRRRRILFWCLLFVGTYFVVELFSLAALQVEYEGWSDEAEAADADWAADGLGTGIQNPDEVVHPYLGTVRRPGTSLAGSFDLQGANEFGFPGGGTPFHKRSPEKVIVGILGGSVAEQFAATKSDLLRTQLARSDEWQGKEIVIVKLSLLGCKQPQQLMIVNYLLSLGAEFDILINLDGFNEVALPAVENVPAHVFAAYPRGWQYRVNQVSDPALLRALGRITVRRDEARFWRQLALSKPLRYSATARLAWHVYRAASTKLLNRDFTEVRQRRTNTADYVATGPRQDFSSPHDVYEHCAKIWARSSLQLHQLCEANRIRYFHFLQPNQYVPDSKPLDREIREAAWQQNHSSKEPVEQAYPILIREGSTLAGRRVAFTNLSMLFRDHSELIYLDACCHLNDRGNEIMALRIAEVVCAGSSGR